MAKTIETLMRFHDWYARENPTASGREIAAAWDEWRFANLIVWAKPGCVVCGDPWWRCAHEHNNEAVDG